MILSTALPLIAGRFGLAPTANRHTTAGLKLYEDKSAGLLSNDPAGESALLKCKLAHFGCLLCASPAVSAIPCNGGGRCSVAAAPQLCPRSNVQG
jgi:photosystem I reaction center PsaK